MCQSPPGEEKKWGTSSLMQKWRPAFKGLLPLEGNEGHGRCRRYIQDDGAVNGCALHDPFFFFCRSRHFESSADSITHFHQIE